MELLFHTGTTTRILYLRDRGHTMIILRDRKHRRKELAARWVHDLTTSPVLSLKIAQPIFVPRDAHGNR